MPAGWLQLTSKHTGPSAQGSVGSHRKKARQCVSGQSASLLHRTAGRFHPVKSGMADKRNNKNSDKSNTDTPPPPNKKIPNKPGTETGKK